MVMLKKNLVQSYWCHGIRFVEIILKKRHCEAKSTEASSFLRQIASPSLAMTQKLISVYWCNIENKMKH